MARYFFFAFIFLLPLQTVYLLREVFVGGEKWQYGSVLIYVSDIILLFSIIAFIFSSWRDLTLQVTRYKLQGTSLALLILWAGLSALWAPDQMLAGYFFVKLLLAAGVFFLARSLSDEDVKIAIKLLIIGAVLESLLGAWQFLSQSTFASTLLGMSAHEVAEAGTSVLKGWHQRWLRAYGTLPHPNMLGGYLAAVFVLCIGYYVSCIEELKRNQRIIFLAGLVVILFGLVVTFSRSAWLGAAMGIAVYYVSRIRYHVWGKLDTQMLLILGIATIAFAGLFHDLVGLRFDSVAIVREGSVSERVQSLEDAKTVIGEGNMLLGTGAGNFTTEMMRLQPERPVWNIQPAHNVPVLVFAELGLVGLVLFLGFLVSILVPILKSKIVNQKSALLVTLVPIALLDHYLWTSHFGLLFLFLLLGLAVRK